MLTSKIVQFRELFYRNQHHAFREPKAAPDLLTSAFFLLTFAFSLTFPPDDSGSWKMSRLNFEQLKSAIRDIPDFPKPGIIFKDITPILKDPLLCRNIVDAFVEKLQSTRIDAVA